jgi:hypothetical protein
LEDISRARFSPRRYLSGTRETIAQNPAAVHVRRAFFAKQSEATALSGAFRKDFAEISFLAKVALIA